MQRTTRQATLWVAPITLALAVCSAMAQHADIAVYSNGDGQVTTHNSTGAQSEQRVFRRNFDFFGPPLDIFAGDDPGIQMSGLAPPAGYSALAGNTQLDLSLVPVHIPGQAMGNLLYWDGASAEVAFSQPPTDHVLFVEDATTVTEVMLDGSQQRFEGLVAGVTDAAGGMHEHMTFALENNGADPASGFYLMSWVLGMDGLDASRHSLVALNPSSMSASVQDQLTTWLEDNVDGITVAGDFDDNGVYELPDVDSLVSAMAGGSDPLAFDLTLDGLVDTSDLDLWRELAGAQLNDSGAPVQIGDANLDGVVDGLDFIDWNTNKFTNTAAWSAGDFNADGIVDGLDFIAWNSNKFTSADGNLFVPEPTSACTVLIAFGAALLARRRLFRVRNQTPYSN